jgi:hypothetical protein
MQTAHPDHDKTEKAFRTLQRLRETGKRGQIRMIFDGKKVSRVTLEQEVEN